MAHQNGILNQKITHYSVIATEFRHFTWFHRWDDNIYSSSSMPLLSAGHLLVLCHCHLHGSYTWRLSGAQRPRRRLLTGKLLIQAIFLMTILLCNRSFCPMVDRIPDVFLIKWHNDLPRMLNLLKHSIVSNSVLNPTSSRKGVTPLDGLISSSFSECWSVSGTLFMASIRMLPDS